MTAHLPALQVVITLLAAPACILVRGRDIAFWLALITTWRPSPSPACCSTR